MPILALTGIRGFAAVAVMLYHFTSDGHSVLAPYFSDGYLGVDLFFVLSGFILQHVYRSHFDKTVSLRGYLTFLQYRLARIYPVHLATMLAMMGLFVIAVVVVHRPPQDPGAFYPFAVASALTLTQGWFDINSPNIPSWSVSAEWFAYLWFPFACLVFARLDSIAKACVLIASLVAIAAQPIRDSGLILYPLARITPEFLIGMAAYDLSRSLRAPLWSGCAVLGAMVVVFFLPALSIAVHVALFALMICALSFPRDWLARLLALSCFTYFGEISYSIYMTHSVVWAALKNVARLAGWPLSSHIFVASAVAATVAVSVLTYHLLEIPARDWIRKVSLRDTKQTAGI